MTFRIAAAVTAGALSVTLPGCATTTKTVIEKTPAPSAAKTVTVTRTVSAPAASGSSPGPSTTQSTPSGSSSSSSGGYPDAITLGTLFAQAIQKDVGSGIQIDATATACTSNVNPGSYQCQSEDQNSNAVTYNVTASNGHWNGTEYPSQNVGSDAGYPHTVSGTY